MKGEAFNDWVAQEAKIAVKHRHNILAAMHGGLQQTKAKGEIGSIGISEGRSVRPCITLASLDQNTVMQSVGRASSTS